MVMIRGLTRALNESGKYKFKPPEAVVDYLVVGGGVVGLAIAQRLSARFPSKSIYLVERHDRAGEEISSRNSEVIHSGLYYPPDSLKTQLCLRGRDLLYERCNAHNIPYRKTGKLVVAKHQQRTYIENLHKKSLGLAWPPHSSQQNSNKLVLPTELLSGDQACELEPDLSKDIAAALWCPETGIIDSHSYMESLEKDIAESTGGELVYSTKVVRVDPYDANSMSSLISGWVVQIVTGNSRDGDALLARTLINASGLSSTLILNSILPEDARLKMYYARGSYASYSGPGISQVSHLIYPCPETGPNAHAFQSLGTHLTLDLQGKIRFGPDIEWVSPPPDSNKFEDDADFWERILIPDESRLSEMHGAVTSYLPDVVLERFQPDYCGMRPKLVPPTGGFLDFIIRTDYPSRSAITNERHNPMISLLGIESPGLTSSLAIAEHVVDDVLSSHS